MSSRSFRQLRLPRDRSHGRQSLQSRNALPIWDDLNAGAGLAAGMGGAMDPELTPRESVVMMLHAAAEIEHALMIQYLFAAYSIRPNIPVPGVAGRTTSVWISLVLQTAKEEMGHLLTIQNALRAVGGPLHFDRDNFPYRSRFYPYPFVLERLTFRALSRFITAEMPEESAVPAAILSATQLADIKAESGGAVNRVGLLFEALLQTVGELTAADLRTDRQPWQADGTAWRGDFTHYGDPATGGLPPTPEAGVVALTFSNRTELERGLDFIANQGESPVQSSNQSHFERFATIYREWAVARQHDASFEPALAILDNPNTSSPPDPGDVLTPEEQVQELAMAAGRISDPRALIWAELFNVRYRIALTALHHYFLCGPALAPAGAVPPGPIRDRLEQWAFDEMLDAPGSIRDLSKLMMKLDSGVGGKYAAPPFELPYSLDLPDLGPERWRLHQDLIAASDKICADLETLSPTGEQLASINGILARDNARKSYITMVKDL